MTYIALVWVSVTIGFVLGAAWTRLCMKGKQIDRLVADKIDEIYSNAHQHELMSNDFCFKPEQH